MSTQPEMIAVPREIDRGLVKTAVSNYAHFRKIDYEAAHAAITLWTERNPHPDDRPGRVPFTMTPRATAIDCHEAWRWAQEHRSSTDSLSQEARWVNDYQEEPKWMNE